MAETTKRTINENARIEQTVNDMEDVSARVDNENDHIDDGVNPLFTLSHLLGLLLEQTIAHEYSNIEEQRTTTRLSTCDIGRGQSGLSTRREDRRSPRLDYSTLGEYVTNARRSHRDETRRSGSDGFSRTTNERTAIVDLQQRVTLL